MGAFRYDNPFMNIMVRIANLMILSFFWLICCVPVLTILPATAALYHTTVRVVHGRGDGVAKDYFHALAGSLKKGIPLSLITAGAGSLLAYSLYIGHQMMERSLAGTFYYFFGIVLAFLLAAAALHLVPALATFEGSVGMYLRLSMYFSAKNLLLSYRPAASPGSLYGPGRAGNEKDDGPLHGGKRPASGAGGSAGRGNPGAGSPGGRHAEH